MKRGIRSIDPISVAGPAAVVFFVVDVAGMVLMLIGSGFVPGVITQSRLGSLLTLGFSGMPPVPLMINWPLVTALLGAILGMLVAWVYNVSVRFTGPIRIELDD